MKFSTLLVAGFLTFFLQKTAAQVVDTVAPTIVCKPGIAVNGLNPSSGTLPGCSVQLFASDFVESASDNVSQPDEILFAIRDPHINPGAGFPLDNAGLPNISLHFGPDQFGAEMVEIWARDNAGNTASCISYLILSDNAGSCDPCFCTQASMCVTSSSGCGAVRDVLFEILPNQPNPSWPNGGPYSFEFINASECYQIPGVPKWQNFHLKPSKNINPLNGISTFDLVRMSKHVLNVQPFTTVFQFIAADINNNKQVTTFDLVELRKVILGIYPKFPANESWRFVRSGTVFDLADPFSKVADTCHVTTSEYWQSTVCDFIGVKIGDVTGDVICNNLAPEPAPDDRSPILFSIENRDLKAGETVDLPIFLEKENALLAWQFALKFDPDLIEILQSADAVKETLPDLSDGSGAMPMVARPAPGGVAANWFSATPRRFLAGRDALISLKINVLRDCKLSDVLFLENEKLAPEAFFSDETSQPVELVFSNKKECATAENLTAWPNPFSEKTTLAWSQNAAGEASIEVFDATGRVVFSQKILGEKRGNRFQLGPISEGLFFVKIQFGNETATAKILFKER